MAREALYDLTVYLLRCGRRRDALALLDQAPPTALARLLSLLSSPFGSGQRQDVNVHELLPYLRLALRAKADEQWIDSTLRELLGQPGARAPLLAALADWRREGGLPPH